MRLVLCTVYVFMGALLFALPNMTRREILFAVPVPPDFREGREGRRAIRMFRLVMVAVVVAAAGALLLSPDGLLNTTAAAIRVATHNSRGLRSRARSDRMVAMAPRRQPPQIATRKPTP